MPAFPDGAKELEPGCSRCPDLVDARERISWGTGAHDARLMIVGEAPGAGDPDADRWQGGNWTGMAYTSRHAGRRIRGMIERLGYADDAYYTNAVKCFPSSGSGRSPTNREPTRDERSTCREHLLRELDEIAPEVVLTTGRHATATMFEADRRELGGFLDTVLEPIRCQEFDVWLLPILHPSYQDVWIPRLGYTPEEYVDAVGSTLQALMRR